MKHVNIVEDSTHSDLVEDNAIISICGKSCKTYLRGKGNEVLVCGDSCSMDALVNQSTLSLHGGNLEVTVLGSGNKTTISGTRGHYVVCDTDSTILIASNESRIEIYGSRCKIIVIGDYNTITLADTAEDIAAFVDGVRNKVICKGKHNVLEIATVNGSYNSSEGKGNVAYVSHTVLKVTINKDVDTLYRYKREYSASVEHYVKTALVKEI